ncbi:MAG: phosphodiester glycosidase family protein [Bacilli bacterium]|nr:phosphodiester glycosidase family protein [Bacilli bacterium]
MKVRKILIGLFSLIFVFFGTVIINARPDAVPDDVSFADGAYFFVEENLETNELPYGVIHRRDWAYSHEKTADGSVPEIDTYLTQQVNSLEISKDANVAFVPWARVDDNKWTLSKVRVLAADFESKYPEYKVIGAINGDGFDINSKLPFPKQPQDITAGLGNFFKSSLGDASGVIGFRHNGTTDTLVNIPNTAERVLTLEIIDSSETVLKSFAIQKSNQTPGDGEIALFYGMYENTTEANHVYNPCAYNFEGLKSWVVKSAETALPNSANDFYGIGTIASNENQLDLQIGQFAIASNNEELNSQLTLDTRIRVQYRLGGEYADIENAIGVFGSVLLKDGEAPSTGNPDVHPRTIIGKKADGTIMMFVIDGRQFGKGFYGLSYAGLSALLKYYDCVDGYNLDGGGSSTLLIKKDGDFLVTNSPSDGQERSDGNCILIVAKDPQLKYQTENLTSDSVTIRADVLNDNNHDIQELFVEVNNQKYYYPANQSTVTIPNLESSSYYYYKFGYKDSANNEVTLLTQGYFYTLKHMFKINGLNIRMGERDFFGTIRESFIMELDFDNVDNIIDSKGIRGRINDRSTDFLLAWNSETNVYDFAVPKSTVVPSIDTVILFLTFDYDGASGPLPSRTIVYHNPQSLGFRTLNDAQIKTDNEIIKIYN